MTSSWMRSNRGVMKKCCLKLLIKFFIWHFIKIHLDVFLSIFVVIVTCNDIRAHHASWIQRSNWHLKLISLTIYLAVYPAAVTNRRNFIWYVSWKISSECYFHQQFAMRAEIFCHAFMTFPSVTHPLSKTRMIWTHFVNSLSATRFIVITFSNTC